MTWMIEGTWRGYRSSQDHVVHREYTTSRKFKESVEKIGPAIRFTDDTLLELAVTEVTGTRQEKEISGYRELIRRCALYGVSVVDDLPRRAS